MALSTSARGAGIPIQILLEATIGNPLDVCPSKTTQNYKPATKKPQRRCFHAENEARKIYNRLWLAQAVYSILRFKDPQQCA